MALQSRLRRLLHLVSASAALLTLVALGAAFSVIVRSGQADPRPELAISDRPTLVFAEFGLNADEILIAPAEDPNDRTLIQTVPHASGWGLNPSSQLVNGRSAYTVLPAGVTPNRNSPAELWLLDVDTASATRLARDADLLAAPVLAQDGAVVAYRRTEGSGAQSLVRVDLETRTRRVLHTDGSSFGLFPVGFDDDGALLFTRLTPDGTDLLRVADGSAAELILHASDEIARDWSVAPDGDAVAFVAPLLQAERIVHQTQVIALGDQPSVEAPAASLSGEQYAPTWRRDGALAIGREATDTSGVGPIVVDGANLSPMAAPSSGFDVPLGWSVVGGYLAVRHFTGSGSQSAGEETLLVIGPAASRVVVETTSELIFLGWTGA